MKQPDFAEFYLKESEQGKLSPSKSAPAFFKVAVRFAERNALKASVFVRGRILWSESQRPHRRRKCKILPEGVRKR